MGQPIAFFEVVSPDHERAQTFYRELFDWQGAPAPAMGGYGLVDTRAGEEAILRLVAHDELAAGQIAAAFEVSRTAISQHVTVLKNAGLLTERRDGTRRLYRARPEGLAELRALLDEMWAGALNVARRLVEA